MWKNNHTKLTAMSIQVWKAVTNWSDTSSTKLESLDKTPGDSKLNRKESYKAQRKNYRKEKKRVASELMNSLQDPAVIVLADWLKVRGTLKSWTKLWCVLKPGLLLIYKSPKTKSSHWVGTVLLTSCQVIERPSKKDGFCFKLFHPMDQSIWAPRGPEKETIGAPSCREMLDGCIGALPALLGPTLRSNSGSGGHNPNSDATLDPALGEVISHETQWSEADYEKHFKEHGGIFLTHRFKQSRKVSESSDASDYPNSMTPSPIPLFQNIYSQIKDSDFEENLKIFGKLGQSPQKLIKSQSLYLNDLTYSPVSDSDLNLDADSQNEQNEIVPAVSGPETETDSENGEIEDVVDEEFTSETPFILNEEEEFGSAGEQVEELPEEHKSLIWFLMKQVRPGMDLSKVVLPTFILEPRSFLDKLSDSYYHADYLSR
uniref:PH domain-containing protein n=1 Tax=Megaselia scalaris TaxID=36166 RepID=T1GEZ2_MEGSC